MESTKELRRICQKPENELPAGELTWDERNLMRGPSIYFTKLFLILGMSANQVTLVDLLIGLVGGILLIFASPVYWILAILPLYLTLIIDRSDGEVARYNGTSSKAGRYWDAMTGFFIWNLYIPVCMCIGIYNALQDTAVFIAGLLVLVSIFFLHGSGSIAYRIFDRISSPVDEFHTNKTAKGKLSIALWLGYYLLTDKWFVLAILVVGLIDLFGSPVTMGFLTFNARFIYFIIYGLAMLIGAILRTYHILSTSGRELRSTYRAE